MKRCNKWDPCERIGPFHKRGFDKHKVVNVDKWGDPLRAKTSYLENHANLFWHDLSDLICLSVLK